jgi:hypothetical protein
LRRRHVDSFHSYVPEWQLGLDYHQIPLRRHTNLTVVQREIRNASPTELHFLARHSVILQVERINDCRRKLARWHALLEQDIQLGIRPSLGLRQSEEAPDEAHKRGAGPEKACLGLPVPRIGVEHIWGDDPVDNSLK